MQMHFSNEFFCWMILHNSEYLPVGCTVFPVAVDAGDEVMNTKEQTWKN